MSTVKDIVAEREGTHGNYEARVNGITAIMEELKKIYFNRYGKEVSPKVATMWNDIVLKLVRSASNPSHEDNWDDLAGYTSLIQEIMGTQNDSNNES